MALESKRATAMRLLGGIGKSALQMKADRLKAKLAPKDDGEAPGEADSTQPGANLEAGGDLPAELHGADALPTDDGNADSSGLMDALDTDDTDGSSGENPMPEDDGIPEPDADDAMGAKPGLGGKGLEGLDDETLKMLLEKLRA